MILGMPPPGMPAGPRQPVPVCEALCNICPSLPLVDDHDEDSVVYTCLTGVALAAASAAARGGGLSSALGRVNAGVVLGLSPAAASASAVQLKCLKAVGEAMQRAAEDEDVEDDLRAAVSQAVSQLAAVM